MDVTIRTWRSDVVGFERLDHADVLAARNAVSEPSTVGWVDILDPTEAEFAPITDALGLDKLAVEDALTVHERPKSLHYGNVFFVTAYTVTEGGSTSRISIFVFERGVVTVRLGASFDTDAVATSVSEDEELLRAGARALELMLLDAIVDGYTDRATKVDESLDEVESILFDGRASDVSQLSFTLHKDVSALRKMVLPMRDVVGPLVRRVASNPELRALLPYAEDVYDHTMRAADWTEMLRDSVESVRSTNLALVDNQLNTVMKKLTGWAAIIAIPTAITGFFGQNVPYPGFGKEWGFWVSVVTIIGLGLLLYAVFKRRGWL